MLYQDWKKINNEIGENLKNNAVQNKQTETSGDTNDGQLLNMNADIMRSIITIEKCVPDKKRLSTIK